MPLRHWVVYTVVESEKQRGARELLESDYHAVEEARERRRTWSKSKVLVILKARLPGTATRMAPSEGVMVSPRRGLAKRQSTLRASTPKPFRPHHSSRRLPHRQHLRPKTPVHRRHRRNMPYSLSGRGGHSRSTCSVQCTRSAHSTPAAARK